MQSTVGTSTCNRVGFLKKWALTINAGRFLHCQWAAATRKGVLAEMNRGNRCAGVGLFLDDFKAA
jgi:hypothetical protein